jgi:hypothetical protein
MPAYSKEKEEYFKSQIKALMVVKPDISASEVTRTLAQRKKNPLMLDRFYVSKLMKKIFRERVYRANYWLLHEKLATFEDKMTESEKKLWEIANDPSARRQDRISALREIRNNNKELFEMFFNAGVFDRKLGELEIHNTFLDLVKAYETRHKNKTNNRELPEKS